MTAGTYSKKFTAALKELGIDISKITHFGRDVGPAIMDMLEVISDQQKNIGNWANDVFFNVYNTKLPLAAMRALAGYDTRRGYYKNPRTRFKGDGKYDDLAAQIFPWVESEMDKLQAGEHQTARCFLQLLLNLRWVILQDCAVMIGRYKRNHFIFNHMSYVFESTSFKNYTTELLNFLSSNVDTNDDKVERILPGMLRRMDDQVQATKDMHDEMNTNFDNTNIDKLEDRMNRVVRKSFGKFATHIGNYQDIDSDNESQLGSQDILQQHNHGTNENIVTPLDDQAVDDPSTLPVYEIPRFLTVESMMNHWDFIVEPCLRKHKSNWRKHLTSADTKKFSRMKKVVSTCKKRIQNGETDALEKFETYYSSNNCSLPKLADKYLK